jgi:hypothetical protein
MTTIGRFGRRHFLRGAGGTLLAVPYLSSLRPRSARAAEPLQRRFVAMCTDHGGIDPRRMLPEASPEATTRVLHAAEAGVPEHRVLVDRLAPRTEGGRTVLSSVLQAPSDRLTPSLVDKLNVLAGFDVSENVAHNRGAFLGNIAATDDNEMLPHVPTIDQLVATAPAFEVRAPRERLVHFGREYGVSSDPRFSASVARYGDMIVPTPAVTDVRRLWERLFSSGDGEVTGRTPVVDRVHAHYQSLLSGAFGDASRLSRDDRLRLEHHVQLLSELQRKLGVSGASDVPAPPSPPDDAMETLQVAVDLVAAALRSGVTHVAVFTTRSEPLTTDTGYTLWHEQIAHDGGGPYDLRNPEYARIGERAEQRFFAEVFVRMARALDEAEDDEGTYLDRSLVYWTMESGEETHLNFGMPVVTAGSAAGYFETGRFVDFRNQASRVLQSEASPFRYPGELLNRFLANALQSMGVAPESYGAEIARVAPDPVANGARGYGVPSYHPEALWTGLDLQQQVWPWSRYERADDPLPGWVRGV